MHKGRVVRREILSKDGDSFIASKDPVNVSNTSSLVSRIVDLSTDAFEIVCKNKLKTAATAIILITIYAACTKSNVKKDGQENKDVNDRDEDQNEDEQS